MDLNLRVKFSAELAADFAAKLVNRPRAVAPLSRCDVPPQIYGYAAMKFCTRRYIAQLYFVPQGASCACDVARR